MLLSLSFLLFTMATVLFNSQGPVRVEWGDVCETNPVSPCVHCVSGTMSVLKLWKAGCRQSGSFIPRKSWGFTVGPLGFPGHFPETALNLVQGLLFRVLPSQPTALH